MKNFSHERITKNKNENSIILKESKKGKIGATQKLKSIFKIEILQQQIIIY